MWPSPPAPRPSSRARGSRKLRAAAICTAGEGIQYPNAMDRLRTLAMRPYLPIAIIFLFLLMALLVWQLANDVPEENSNSVTATVTSTNSTAP